MQYLKVLNQLKKEIINFKSNNNYYINKII